jgi:hypothetical protein
MIEAGWIFLIVLVVGIISWTLVRGVLAYLHSELYLRRLAIIRANNILKRK